MSRTLLALSCGLILATGSALAQQQSPAPKPANDTSGPSMTDKAKDAAQAIGEKAKKAMDKVKDMAQESAQKSKADDERQKQADADLKSAKAKCDPIEPQVRKTVCEKQAAATHANAELRIAKANAAAQTGKTSTMGAGKAAR